MPYQEVTTTDSPNTGRGKWNANDTELYGRFNTFENVASQAAMLALAAKQGDVAVRTDLTPDGAYRLSAEPATTLANWVQISGFGGSGAGVTDHGALTGLADDDHTQYHNDTRGDARYPLLVHTHDDRYYTETEADAALSGKASTTHGTSHVTGGSDVISNAIAAGNSGLMSGADKTKLNGIETAATADQTASEILSALLTVDGAGTSLDADTVDGSHAAAFASASHNHAAADVNSGTMATARLGSGTADNTVFLRGDQTWAAPSAGSGYRTLVTLGADVTNNNATANTLQDVTGLSFAVTSGTTYRFQFMIIYTAAAITTGSRWSIDGPATPTLFAFTSRTPLNTSQDSVIHGNTYNSGAISGSSMSTTGNLAVIEGIIIPSASGTVIARFASEITGSAIIAKAGSMLEWW